jgi:hypothetical protein
LVLFSQRNNKRLSTPTNRTHLLLSWASAIALAFHFSTAAISPMFGNPVFHFSSVNGVGGTRTVPYSVTTLPDGTSQVHLHSITAKAPYHHKSFEELRFEDCLIGENKSTSTTTAGIARPLAPIQWNFSGGGAASGTRHVPYVATSVPDGTSFLTLHSINAMPVYQDKSAEELRLEDCSMGKRKSTHTSAAGFLGSPESGADAGTRRAPYVATSVSEDTSFIRLRSISAMLAYQGKSFEELRFEDYSSGNRGIAVEKNIRFTFGSSTLTPGSFSFGSATAPSVVSATPATFSFGSTKPSGPMSLGARSRCSAGTSGRRARGRRRPLSSRASAPSSSTASCASFPIGLNLGSTTPASSTAALRGGLSSLSLSDGAKPVFPGFGGSAPRAAGPGVVFGSAVMPAGDRTSEVTSPTIRVASVASSSAVASEPYSGNQKTEELRFVFRDSTKSQDSASVGNDPLGFFGTPAPARGGSRWYLFESTPGV